MIRFTHRFHHVTRLVCTLLILLGDALRCLRLCPHPSPTLVAENLFLRKQLALYQERKVNPSRATHATRLPLTVLARWVDWRQALVIVQPQTLIYWHRQGFRLFWRWTSRPGRPLLPADLRRLIRRMARENLTWGEERIANELLLTLGLRVSPRTVRKYVPTRSHRGRHQRSRDRAGGLRSLSQGGRSIGVGRWLNGLVSLMQDRGQERRAWPRWRRV